MTSLPCIIVYLDSELARRAQAAAEASGTNLSAVIRAAILIQVQRPERPLGSAVRAGERATKVRLHVESEVKEALAKVAMANGMSRSTWIARALADALDRAHAHVECAA